MTAAGEQGVQVAAGLSVTESSGEEIIKGLGLNPSRLAGRKVLDLASGGSSLVEELRGQGVHAYGVDLAYDDTSSLLERVNKFRKSLIGQPPLTSLPMIEDPSGYVAGNALLLPFQDNVFHKVINTSFLTSGAGCFREFTNACVQEALRVLEPGGELVLGFLLDQGLLASLESAQTARRNITAAFEAAREQRLARKIAMLNLSDSSKVFKITKR